MLAQAIPGLVVGFREGIEAFLIIGIMLQYLSKIKRGELKRYVFRGLYTGIAGSVLIGLILWGISTLIGQGGGAVAKLWESGASFAALIFISTLIYWMMKHGRTISTEVESGVSRNLSAYGLFILASIMVLREGAEIALFAFTAVEKNIYLMGVFSGIIIAAVLAILIYKSLVRVELSAIFRITLVYLIFQAGYMLGYSVHEFLSALKTLNRLNPENSLLMKLFDLSGTVFDHKNGILGLPLNVLIGWYSKPEIIQFAVQYGYTLSGFLIWTRLAGLQAKKTDWKPDFFTAGIGCFCRSIY